MKNINYMAYGTRRFKAAFTTALQYSLSSAESTKFFVLTSISLRSILIFYHLRLRLPKGLLPIGVPVKILKALLPFSVVFLNKDRFIV